VQAPEKAAAAPATSLGRSLTRWLTGSKAPASPEKAAADAAGTAADVASPQPPASGRSYTSAVDAGMQSARSTASAASFKWALPKPRLCDPQSAHTHGMTCSCHRTLPCLIPLREAGNAPTVCANEVVVRLLSSKRHAQNVKILCVSSFPSSCFMN
jgi:hypothetical protein